MTDDTTQPTEAERLRQENEQLREANRDLVARYGQPAAPPPNIVKPGDNTRYFYRSVLRDLPYFQANKAEINRAAALGRILPDPAEPDWRVPGGTTQAQRAQETR